MTNLEQERKNTLFEWRGPLNHYFASIEVSVSIFVSGTFHKGCKHVFNISAFSNHQMKPLTHFAEEQQELTCVTAYEERNDLLFLHLLTAVRLLI